MKYHFFKMQGLGNDYIFFDCRNMATEKIIKSVKKLSNRHFGIGSDGVVIIENSEIATVKMRIFNSDGSEGKTCGNALRCIGKYVCENTGNTEINVETLSGVRNIRISHDIQTVNMGKAEFQKETTIILNGVEKEVHYVSIGNPHCVIFTDTPEQDLIKYGKTLEITLLQGGTNIEFVKSIDKTVFQVFVWERGSGRTLACGSGACAVASVVWKKENNINETKILLEGGELSIKIKDDVIYMSGKSEKVFEGNIEIE